ncbi:hypothetical protein SAMN02745136_01789 [Anaerocolumna jejuensis DSM 15929]|uniref:DUF2178 domain-containing protein n=1 Tax=Anaerocolumna jejuensis DSM 15929 TaxID=1121322 RepID=A0A1M6PY72_9FIRM|nr:hypothetical protein [Anaerocolumna jejuensis]SHK12899.1 hypothetical protein SAMN02745136_01789 [Anaerocolumna jejuensis DSM 15929]
MKSNKDGKYAIFSVLGFIIFAAGFVLLRFVRDGEGIMRTLPYLFIGVGAGVFGQNLGELLKIQAVKKNPQAAKQIEIEAKDERNIIISNKAKARAYDLMLMVFGALMLAFALMQVEIYVILIFTAAYLFIVFSNVYYLSRYQKEM